MLSRPRAFGVTDAEMDAEGLIAADVGVAVDCDVELHLAEQVVENLSRGRAACPAG